MALLWVVWHHLAYIIHPRTYMHNQTLGLIASRLGFLGFLGVDMFFVISGFLITEILFNDLKSRIQIKRFYIRRFLRIIPHYLVILLVGFLIIFAFRLKCTYDLKSLLGYLFLFENYVQPISVFGHLWAIAVECHFYLVYPVLMHLTCQLSKDPEGRQRALLFLLIILIFLINIIRLVQFKDLTSINDPTVWQVSHVRMDALFFGCVLRLIYPKLLSLTQGTKDLLRIISFAVGFLLFLYFFMHFNKIGWFDYTLAYLASGSLIIAGLLGFIPLTHVSNLSLLRYLGKNSYGIYLWHYILKYPFLKIRSSVEAPTFVVLFIITSIMLGILTTETLEKYFINKRKKLMP